MDPIITKLQALGRLGKTPKQVAAVAAFEDASTEARVNEFCRSLGRHFGTKCKVTQQMWMFNELRIAQLRGIAADEASQADFVIISVHHAQSFPSEVKEWIDLWLGQKGNRATALLALFDPVYSGDSSALQSYLKDAAKRGRLEFLFRCEEMPDED